MSDNLKIQDTHLRRSAYVYIRQSSATQVLVNRESTERQYQLTERAAQMGWSRAQIKVIDEDLAHTGSGLVTRHGFTQMTHEVAMGQVGIILCLEASRIARNNAEWYRLLELCGVRVGINTGLVVVGEVGSDLKYEYTAMGDAVNLAARMQTAARPGTVLVSENTYRYIQPVVDATDLGPIEVKGKAEPVRVYEVQAMKAEPGRLRGLAGLESPMVGRAVELKAVLGLSEAVKAGKGHAVLVVGEPGLGKSRLISEWKSASSSSPTSRGQTAAVDLKWAEGHCLSYGQGLAYHLLIDALRSLIGVHSAAGEIETRAALQALCDNLFAGSALDVFPYLAHLLSLPLEGAARERVQALDPQALQSQYLAGVRHLLQAQAARQPLVLILDDIHWADPSSTELFIKLLPLSGEAPILFCFLTRPDRDAPGWKLVTSARESLGSDRFVELTLNPLSDSDSRQLVSNLLEIEALPDRMRAAILQKAEGNPFFVEEVIRMLMDRGAIVKKEGAWAVGKEIDTVEITDNLQGLLLARIDRMPEDVKRTLRVASVIGRQFSVRVLEQVLEQA